MSAVYRMATIQAAAWPRTRRMLRRLAAGFDSEARRLDEDAELRRRGLDQ